MAVNMQELQKKCDERGIRILKLQEMLFCIREVAVVDFNDIMVWLADKELDKDFHITKTRFRSILGEYPKSKGTAPGGVPDI